MVECNVWLRLQGNILSTIKNFRRGLLTQYMNNINKDEFSSLEICLKKKKTHKKT